VIILVRPDQAPSRTEPAQASAKPHP